MPIIINVPTCCTDTDKNLKDVRATKGVAVRLMDSNEALEHNGTFCD